MKKTIIIFLILTGIAVVLVSCFIATPVRDNENDPGFGLEGYVPLMITGVEFRGGLDPDSFEFRIIDDENSSELIEEYDVEFDFAAGDEGGGSSMFLQAADVWASLSWPPSYQDLKGIWIRALSSDGNYGEYYKTTYSLEAEGVYHSEYRPFNVTTFTDIVTDGDDIYAGGYFTPGNMFLVNIDLTGALNNGLGGTGSYTNNIGILRAVDLMMSGHLYSFLRDHSAIGWYKNEEPGMLLAATSTDVKVKKTGRFNDLHYVCGSWDDSTTYSMMLGEVDLPGQSLVRSKYIDSGFFSSAYSGYSRAYGTDMCYIPSDDTIYVIGYADDGAGETRPFVETMDASSGTFNGSFNELGTYWGSQGTHYIIAYNEYDNCIYIGTQGRIERFTVGPFEPDGIFSLSNDNANFLPDSKPVEFLFQPNGKIIIVTTEVTPQDGRVYRYNSDGTLDVSFGEAETSGYFERTDCILNAGAITSSGYITAAGFSNDLNDGIIWILK